MNDHAVRGYNQGGGGSDYGSIMGSQISGAFGNHGSGGYFQLGGGSAGYGQSQGGYVHQAGLGHHMGGANSGQDYWQGGNVGPMRSGFGGQQLPPWGSYRHNPY